MTTAKQGAAALGKRRASVLSPSRRREIARDAAIMRWTPLTKQDKRIRERVRQVLLDAIDEAVDVLFARLKEDGRPRALVIHQGDVRVYDVAKLEYRIFASKHPDAVVGTYNRSSNRQQVLDDLAETDACASIMKRA